jgi:maltokinase
VPVADLPLDARHALRVTGTADGPRAEPVTLTDGAWERSVPGDGAGLALLARLGLGAAQVDEFRVTASGRPDLDDRSERAMGVDQTHDSWVVGGRVVVKWMTEPLVGPHPAAGRLRRLDAVGFEESPELWGVVEWCEPGTGHWVPVAIAQSYLPETEDGWTWAVLDARRALGLEPGEPTDFAADLGGVVGRMHLALAEDPPTRLSASGAREQADEALAALALAVRLTEQHDPESHALLTRHRPRIEAVLGHLVDAVSTPILPVHGDLHVGQVLRGPTGYAVVDFDGNPTRSPALRAASAPAACDVAHMLVSLENVGHVVGHGAGHGTGHRAGHRAGHVAGGGDDTTLGPALRAWTARVQGRFLSSYTDALGARLELFDAALVPAYEWEQVCREIVYAVRHDLLEWLYVPAASLRRRLGAERSWTPTSSSPT